MKLFVKLVLFLVSISAFSFFYFVAFQYWQYRDDIPKVVEPADFLPTMNSRVYAKSGELIAEFGSSSRIIIEQEKIPKFVYKAFIASEDKNFYSHHGVDFLGTIISLKDFFFSHRASQRGASTITQQLAKNLLIDDEGFLEGSKRSIKRKIREAILARKIEQKLSKDDILWLYVNQVYLGNSSYGIASASVSYFSKSLNELNLSQVALLAGLPQAPSKYSPVKNSELALARQRYVLRRMLINEFISEDEYKKALSFDVIASINPKINRFRSIAPYFSEQVRRELIAKYGEKTLYEGGLEIFTTLNINRQIISKEEIQKGILTVDKRQGYYGPLYSCSNNEYGKCLQVVKELNEERKEFFYGIVKKIDESSKNSHAIVDGGNFFGILLKANMLWARAQDHTKNYLYYKLKRIDEAFKEGDVIIVKKYSQEKIDDLHDDEKKLITSVKRTDKKNIYFVSLEQEPNVEGAMIVVEPKTGYIEAIQGGFSYEKSEFNRIFQSCRQPGSLFKPIVFSKALTMPQYSAATMLMDTPLTFIDADHEFMWKPRNINRKYLGEVVLRDAFIRSINVPTINLAKDLGMSDVISWAKNLGIKTSLKHEFGTAIGSSCVAPIEMTQVFGIYANLGKNIPFKIIREVKDRFGTTIESSYSPFDPYVSIQKRMSLAFDTFLSKEDRRIDEDSAYLTHHILADTVAHGTAVRLKALDHPFAGKTGTTNDNFDLYFAGYTADLLSLLWIGPDKMDIPLNTYEQGGRTTLPVFLNFAKRALHNSKKISWPPFSENLCEAIIDKKTGKRLESIKENSFVGLFRCGHEPDFYEEKSKSLDEFLQGDKEPLEDEEERLIDP